MIFENAESAAPTEFLFLPADFDGLNAQIEVVRERIREQKQLSAEAVEQSSESWHDNYPFEEAQRQLKSLYLQFAELSTMKKHARVVNPTHSTSEIGFGSTVTYRNMTHGFTDTVTIGSYHVFSHDHRDDGVISYESPLARLMLGATVGSVIDGEINSQQVTVEVVEVT